MGRFVFETPLYTDGEIVLTGYGESDVAAHLEGEDGETARRFGWWPKRSTPETVRAAFRRWAADWTNDGPTRTFAVRDRRTGELFGGCQLHRHQGQPHTVSYWTSASHRGQRVATRALTLLLQHARSESVVVVVCEVAEDNIASRRVAEAAGFSDPTRVIDADGQVMIRYQWAANPPKRP